MARRSAVILVVLGLVACTKEGGSAAPSTEAPAAASTAPAPAAAPAAPAKPQLDAASLDAYLTYERALAASLEKRLGDYKKILADAQTMTDATKTAAVLKAESDLATAIDADKAKAAAAAKLAPDVVAAWDDVCGAIALLHSGPLAQLEKVAAEQHARIDGLPPEQREASLTAIKEIDGEIAKRKHLDDQRRQYGDAAVDVAVKREADVLALHQKRLDLLTALKNEGTKTK